MAAPDELRFQELEAATAALRAAPPDAPTTPQEGPTAVAVEEGDDTDTTELLGEQRSPRSFWTFEYYQSFFDVDTQQVLERIKGSVTPLPGKSFVRHRLRNGPDLYGPFWICATLALALAVSGNLSHLAQKRRDPGYRYSPQFHNVTVAATLVYSYAGLVPLGLWGFLRWRSRGPVGLLETLCLYGYSLSAYVPTAVLWLIPLPWLQWVLLGGAALLSASVLALTFWPVARSEGRATAVAVVATITSLHTLLAVACKLYFYQGPPNVTPAPSLVATVAEGLHSHLLSPAGTNLSLPGTHPAR